MNLEKITKYNKDAADKNKEVEGDSTILIQKQNPFKPFDGENVGKDNKRLPASPEQVEKMDKTLEELTTLFNGFDKWHLDGALNISLLKKEYIGNHKDVDLSVERINLKELELFLEKKGCGFFISQNKKDGNSGEKILRRVSYVGIENYKGHPMICAIDDKGKIDDSKNLNYIDLHIIDRDDNNLPLLASGINCKEEWTKSYPIEKNGQKINLSHPAKVLYYKLNQGRNYDSTDIDRLLELDVIKESDIDEIKDIFEKEFIKKGESISTICTKISEKIRPEMNSEEIFNKIKNLDDFKDEDYLNDSLKLFSEKLFNSKERSPKSIYNLAIQLFDVENNNQEKINNLNKIKQTISDKERINEIRNEISL